MKITITHLRLINFKGIPEFEISPGNQTTISADNAVGKTTLFDAHNWLWAGKDSQDRKDFEIKPLDKSGRATSRVISEVQETIDFDGQIIVLRRAFEEKWVKKKGSTEAEYAGNITSFWYNEVPCNQSEFKAKIDLIISEDKNKLLTNPHYFNNNLSWQQRRAILSNMAGEVSDSEVVDTIATVENKTELGALIAALNNKTLEDYKKEVSAKRKLVKEKLEQIPTRIDEAERSKPTPVNDSEINKGISERETAISEIDNRISGLQKAQEFEYEKVRELQKEKHNLQTQIQEEKNKAGESKTKRIGELSEEKSRAQSASILVSGKCDVLGSEIKSKELKVVHLKSENDTIREDFNRGAEKQFVAPTAEHCPSCGKPVDAVIDVDKLREEFETKKAAFLESKRNVGLSNKTDIEFIEGEIEKLKKDLEIAQAELSEAKGKVDNIQKQIDETRAQETPANETIITLEKQLSELVIPEVSPISVSEDQSLKKELERQIAELRASLSVNDQIARLNTRIAELKQEERTLAQELANHEKVENTIMAFSKAKIEAVEKKVSGMFQHVTFKMFNELINGGEEPTCICQLNGVPYSDLNTASKINAGLDIINTLSAHYGIFAPIWIDGRESINQLLPVNGQLICLKVGTEKQLTILS